jgi:hypothetical protein
MHLAGLLQERYAQGIPPPERSEDLEYETVHGERVQCPVWSFCACEASSLG